MAGMKVGLQTKDAKPKAPFTDNRKPPTNPSQQINAKASQGSTTDKNRSLESYDKKNLSNDKLEKVIGEIELQKVKKFLRQDFFCNFSFDKTLSMHRQEFSKWKLNDQKGQKKVIYLKSVQKANDLILNVAQQSRLEMNANYEDRWPLLNLRKELIKVKILINMAAIKIMTHKVFENFSIAVIMANSITLAKEDPLSLVINPTDDAIEKVFLSIYTVEMCIKILALGFVLNHGAYLRSIWNVLDFVIIMSAYLTIIQEVPAIAAMNQGNSQNQDGDGFSLNSLRALRVLRPLRAITSIKGLRVIVLSIIKAMPLLKDTLIVLLFFFLIFAIMSTMLLAGSAKQMCINIETGQFYPGNGQYAITNYLQAVDGGSDLAGIMCGGSEVCPPGYFCGKLNANPDYNVSNYDNVFWSLLNTFILISLEGWSTLQIYYQMTVSYYIFVLFFMQVLLGAFFMINLLLAVINSSFGRTMAEYQRLEEEAKAKLKGKKKQSGDVEVKIQDDEEEEKPEKMGVHEYFIAKRASKKMIEFFRMRQAKKQQEKADKAQKNDEQEDEEGATEPARVDQKQELRQQKKTVTIAEIPNVVTEESEDIDHEKAVAKFLQEIEAPHQVVDGKRTIGQILPIQKMNLRSDKKIQKAETLTEGSKFDVLLDIEKVIGQQDDQQNDSGEHPFDLSFLQSQFYDEISNDEKTKNKLKDKSFNEFDEAGSLQSDGSLKDQIDYWITHKQKQDEVKRVKPLTNQEIMKDISKRKKQEIQKQMDMSNQEDAKLNNNQIALLNEAKQTAAEIRTQTLNRESHKKKKQFLQQINNMDEFLKGGRPKDPYEFIDKKTQKIEITPNVPYKSSSQDEVFELRNKLADQQYLSNENQYLKIIDKKALEFKPDDDDIDRDYVKTGWEAYQLKRRYDINLIEQVEFEEDDEDYLILAMQPYDTVMNVAYGQLLTHLPTKFRTRRSDIILSSSLSITLIPSDPKFKKKDLALLKKDDSKDIDEIVEWSNLRHKYRATQVQSYKKTNSHNNMFNNNSTLGKSRNKNQDNQELQEDNLKSQSSEEAEKNAMFGESEEDEKLQVQTLKQKLIPPSLLYQPIHHYQIQQLDDDEKKLYMQQKNKNEAQLKKIKKMPVHPTLRRYDLEDAKKMLIGEFHEDENQQVEEETQKNHMLYLGRDETFGDIRLDQFEKAIKDVLKDKEERFKSKQEKGDNIPKELREELELPDDLENNEIDFDQVRKKDCSVARRTLMWSGQDVMCLGLNEEQFGWIADHLTAVRVWPKGIHGVFKKIRVAMRMLVRSSFWENFLIICVLINTAAMASLRYNQPKSEELFMEQLNNVLTWIFIVEMMIKVIAIGPKKYINDKMNWLDGLVVSLSLVEIFMNAFAEGESGGNLSAFKTIRVFRTFRVLRVIRLLRALHSMQVILQVIQRSADSFMYIIMLLFVFIFIFTLLGLNFFGGKMTYWDGTPQQNFDTFMNGAITVFQILTTENWNSTLYQVLRSNVSPWLSSAYFVLWIFVGNFILLNVFLAILLDAFLEEDDGSEEDILERERQEELKKKQMIQQEKERRIKKLGPSMFKSGKFSHEQTREKKKKDQKTFFNKTKLPELIVDNIDDLDEKQIMEIFIDEGVIKKKDKAREDALLFHDVACEKALYLLSKQNKFRIFMYKMYKNKIFDNFIMLVIGLSSMKLAADTYLNGFQDTDLPVIVSNYIDLCLNCIFYVEFVCKIVSMGFMMDEGSYIREGWNQLDFFIVVTSLMDIVMQDFKVPALKVLRLLRTLRPLRVISHNVAMKLIVAALFESVGAISNVIIVVFCVWLMFAIFAVNLYSGKFFSCSISQYTYRNKQTCNQAGGSWSAWYLNFDSITQAMLTLFTVASLEGWPDTMNIAIQSQAVDLGPKQFANPINAVFFWIFILIGSYFLLNFFIGVLFLQYSKAQLQEKKGYTQENLNWIDMQRMIIKAECPFEIMNQPDPKKNKLRYKIWKVINSNPFDYFIMATIILNVIQMGCQYENQSAGVDKVLQITNYIFTVIFIFEAILKLIAYQFAYFKTTWNKFDFFIVCTSIVDILMGFAPQGGGNQALSLGPQLARILRVLRVSRILRLAGKNQGLMALMQTITMSIGPLMNVFLLLMLVLFIFSVLAVFFFGSITEGQSGQIFKYKNFNNFGNSFIFLYILTTGENWPYVMQDCSNTPPNCLENKDCGSSYAPFYWIVFVVFVQQVMLNLFVLVILEQFEQYYVSDDNPIQKFKINTEIFMEVWIRFTSQKYRCVKLRERRLFDFFRALPPPIGMPDDTPDSEMKKIMIKMGIRSEEGYIYFNELLYRCMRNAYGNFKLNKKLQIAEIMTQLLIMKKTQAAKQKTNTKAAMDQAMKDHEMFLVKGQNTSNPFLQYMYYKITFKTWVKIMRDIQKRKVYEAEQANQRKKAELLGMPFINQPFQPEKEPMSMVQIQIERIEILTTDGESDDSESQNTSKMGKSQKAALMKRGGTIRNGMSMKASSNSNLNVMRKQTQATAMKLLQRENKVQE